MNKDFRQERVRVDRHLERAHELLAGVQRNGERSTIEDDLMNAIWRLLDHAKLAAEPDLGAEAFEGDNAGHDTDCDCKACLIDRWYAETNELRREVNRLREAIHAHRVARRYNPRAAWVDARLWDSTGEEV